MNISKLEAAKKVIQNLRSWRDEYSYDVEFFYPSRINELEQELQRVIDALNITELELDDMEMRLKEKEAEFKKEFGFLP